MIGGNRDGSGEKYMRNRYYDPATATFTQKDPIGLAGGVNLYGYAGQDPVNYADPFGLCPIPGLCEWLDFSANHPIAAAAVANIVTQEVQGFACASDPSCAGPPAAGGTGYLLGLAAQVLPTARVIGSGAAAAVEGSAESATMEVIPRKALGRDGGKSFHVLEKIEGRTNSVTHRVESDGNIIHQHQTHIGKYGGQRRFPDEWTGTKTIDKPQ